MAILFIDNQPLTWKEKEATYDGCKRYNEHGCTTYTTFDWLYAQWKQQPCAGGANVFCNPDFTNSNPLKISNPDFTSGSTGWTLTNATWDSVNKRINFSGASNGTMVYTDSFSIGSVYKVTITVGGATQGYLTVSLRGATNFSTIYGTGSYTFYITAGSSVNNNINIASTSIWNGWVDDVQVQLQGIDCTEFSGVNQANDWNVLAPGVIKKNADYAADFYALFNPGTQVGGYYKVSFTVTNWTQGQLFIQDGIQTLLTVSSNGYFEYFDTITSITGVGSIGVGFSATAEFDGVISGIQAIQYANYFQVRLESTTGGPVYDLSGNLEYYQDYLTLKKELSLITPGCYELCIYDACGQNVGQELLSDITFGSPGDWSLDPSYGSATVAGGKLTFTSGLGPTHQFSATNVNLWPSYNNMVIDWSFSAGLWEGSGVSVFIIGKNGVPHLLCYPIANQTYSGTLSLANQGSSSGIAIQILVVFPSPPNNKKLELLDFSIVLQAYIPGRMNVYCSNCIEIKDDDSCLTWVSGRNGEDSFGFHFDPLSGIPFEIGARVNAMMINPKYKGALKTYNDSEGNNFVTKAKTDKQYTLFVNYTDEHTHDWLRTAVLSDTVKIGSFAAGYDEYVAVDGDYQPEWPDNLGTWPTAQARIDLIPKTKTIYNNNAG